MITVAKTVTWCAFLGLVGMMIMFQGFKVWMDPRVHTGWRIYLVSAGLGLSVLSAGVAVFETWLYVLTGAP